MARVPYVNREDLAEEQKHIFDRIAKTRGSVQNVFAALMNSPEAAHVVTSVGEYIRYKSKLDPAIRETAILTTAKEVNAILSGKGPMGLPAKEGIFIQAAKELVRDATLNKKTFQALEHLLGVEQTIDFLVTVGYYSMVARVISALEVDFDDWLNLNDQFNDN